MRDSAGRADFGARSPLSRANTVTGYLRNWCHLGFRGRGSVFMVVRSEVNVVLRVSPAVLTHVAEEFGAVAQGLRAGLGSIDDEIGSPLGGAWTGKASSSYDVVWREWHEGASKVLQGLTAMSTLLTVAANRYSQTDQAGASGIDAAGV